LLLIRPTKLKTTFQAIITYRETTSGTHWDNKKGANIEGDAAANTWMTYLNAAKVWRYSLHFHHYLISLILDAG